MDDISTQFFIKEQQMLKELKENGEKLNWGKIARRINEKFQNSYKNGKQCRDKYINYAQFGEQNQLRPTWTPEEDAVLIQLYKESGSCWSKYTKILPHKNENAFKNRFYNSVRRASKLIEDHQKKVLNQFRSFITYQIITKILDLCVLIQTQFGGAQSNFNKNSALFNCREQILQLMFSEECPLSQNQITKLIKYIRMIVKKLKSFKIFKRKNKNDWELTSDVVDMVLSIGQSDNTEQSSSNQKKAENTQLQQFAIIICKYEQVW